MIQATEARTQGDWQRAVEDLQSQVDGLRSELLNLAARLEHPLSESAERARQLSDGKQQRARSMAGEEGGQVIDLGSRGGYAPDMASLARSHVVKARERLGLSAAEFAAVLEPFLDWPVSGGVVESWETTGTPPGDALLAIGIVARRRGGFCASL